MSISLPENPSQPPSKRQIQFWQEERAKLADMGREFPYEFIDAMQTNAYETARKWLQDNGAPEELIQILDNAIMLQRYYDWIKAGTLDDMNASEIPSMVAQTSHLIVLFGGTFDDPAGSAPAREPVIIWPGKSSKQSKKGG